MDCWKEQLHGVPTSLELPLDYPRPPIQTSNGSSEKITLPKRLFQGLEKLSQEKDATLFITLLAAFKVLLYRYTSQDDIVVGSPIANRTRREVEDLVGLFVNPLALRTDLSGDPQFSNLLENVRENLLGAYGHQDLPFEKLVEEIQPDRDLSKTPIFQVMFIMQNEPEHTFDLPGISVKEKELEVLTCQFDLVLDMKMSSQGIEGRLEYHSDLFRKSSIVEMVKNFHLLDPDSASQKVLFGGLRGLL